MNHDDIRHMLSAYLDGSTTADEKRIIGEHLKTCPDCGRAFEELQKTVGHIRSLEEVEPPAWMTQKIMAHVRDAAEEKEGGAFGLAHASRAAAKGRLAEESAQPATVPAPASKKESLFRRFFAPARFRTPLQAVAVLFLVVTAFYIFRTMEPAQKAMQTPQEHPSDAMQKSAPSLPLPEKPARMLSREERTKAPEQQAPAGNVPQSPAYKALDMKPRQEPVAPPVLRESAPVPAAPAAKPQPAEAPEQEKRQATGFQTFDSAAGAGMEAKDERSFAKKKERAAAPADAEATSGIAATRTPGDDPVRRRIIDRFLKQDLPKSKNHGELKYILFEESSPPPDLFRADKGAAGKEFPCRRIYRIDLTLDSVPWQYFYCVDEPDIAFLGKYTREHGVWKKSR
jgi:hypothetical protein